LNAEMIESENKDHYCEPSNAPYIFSILKKAIGF